jgi:hypothetical protein
MSQPHKSTQPGIWASRLYSYLVRPGYRARNPHHRLLRGSGVDLGHYVREIGPTAIISMRVTSFRTTRKLKNWERAKAAWKFWKALG